jgi:hypothetical protein
VLGAKRQIRRVDFDSDDDDSLPTDHHGIHRNFRADRFADASSPTSASARTPRGSPSSARVAPSPASSRQEEDEEEEKKRLRMLSFAPASGTPRVAPASPRVAPTTPRVVSATPRGAPVVPELLDFTRRPSPRLATEGRRRQSRVENEEGPDIPPVIASPRASDGAWAARRASRQVRH